MAIRITQSLGATGNNRKLFIALLTPSWLSGLVIVTVSVAAIVGSIGINYYGGTGLQSLFNLHGIANNASVSSTSQAFSNNFSANTAVSDIPLLIFWAGVGLGVYSLATNLFGGLRNIVGLGAELNYVNVNRRELLRTSLETLLLRVVILVGWFFFIHATTQIILPLVFSLVRVSTNHNGTIIAVSYPLAAIGILIVCLHLHTILLRALWLKSRLFGQSRYL